MTITIITDKDRADSLLKNAYGYYQAEQFDPEHKMSSDQVGVRLTFPDYYNVDMISLLMFHNGIKHGIDKSIETIYKPDRFKSDNISVSGRNEN